jgi:hypothetical protein
MLEEGKDMSTEADDAVASVTARSADLVEEYTDKLNTFVNGLVPPFLDNAEYAARTSALMIAFNRQLGRCATAFGNAHGVSPEAMIELVVAQFVKNMAVCAEAVEGDGETRQ